MFKEHILNYIPQKCETKKNKIIDKRAGQINCYSSCSELFVVRVKFTLLTWLKFSMIRNMA